MQPMAARAQAAEAALEDTFMQMITDGKRMMNLGNRQAFSNQRDLVNTSERAFCLILA